MGDPFKLFGRLLLAFFKVAGYTVSCGLQAAWCLLHRRPELIHDAIGDYGRGVTDTIAGIFEW